MPTTMVPMPYSICASGWGNVGRPASVNQRAAAKDGRLRVRVTERNHPMICGVQRLHCWGHNWGQRQPTRALRHARRPTPATQAARRKHVLPQHFKTAAFNRSATPPYVLIVRRWTTPQAPHPRSLRTAGNDGIRRVILRLARGGLSAGHVRCILARSRAAIQWVHGGLMHR
jgi:hypothetical protein